MKITQTVLFLILGTAFGLILSRSGAADYNYIQNMFLFKDIQLYGIIGSAVMFLAPGMWLLQKYGKTADGQPITILPKPFNRGNLFGGVLFGIGWSITGMCPGPIMVNIGEGKVYALAALAGGFVGTMLVGYGYDFWQRLLNLPTINIENGA